MITNEYIILIGSNIDADINLARAKALISCIVTITKTSRVYQTTSINPAYPDFLNQAIQVSTSLPEISLRKELRLIEAQLYRERGSDPYASITIDLDLYMVNDVWCQKAVEDLEHEQLLVALTDIIPHKKLPNGIVLQKYFNQIATGKRYKIESITKTALITGASKRIGRALALAFAKKGYDIILHSSKPSDLTQEVADIIKMMGQDCVVWYQDFSESNYDMGILKNHRIDLLINCAAVFISDEAIKHQAHLAHQQYLINYEAPKKLIHTFVEHHKYGHIINILDKNIASHDRHHRHYIMTKKMLYELGLDITSKYMPHIRANAICPGWILDPVNQEPLEYHKVQKTILAKRLPRKGDVADVVSAAIFLQDNTFINGQVIFLDGGRRLL